MASLTPTTTNYRLIDNWEAKREVEINKEEAEGVEEIEEVEEEKRKVALNRGDVWGRI